MSYITHTRQGSWCDACGAVLSQEEIDFDCCDCCGGEGFDFDEGDDVAIEDLEDPSEERR